LASAQDSLKALATKAEGNEERIKQAEERLRVIADELAKLEGIDGKVEAKSNDCKQSLEYGLKLKDLKESVTGLQQHEVRVALLKETFTQKTNEAANAKKHYSDLYDVFLKNQAGLLGVELAHSIESNGSAACPVCRTMFSRGVHSFAKPADGAPDEKTVKLAKEAFELAEKARGEAQTKFSAEEGKLSTGIENALKTAQELGLSADWQSLPETVNAALIQARQDHKQLTDALKQLEALKQNRTDLLAEQKTKNDALSKDRSEKDQIAQQIQEASNKISVLNGRIEGQRKQLSTYATKDDAEGAKASAEQESGKLKNAIEVAEKDASAKNGVYSQLKGTLD